MSVTGRTRVAAVVGSPIRHSLSPVVYNAAFAACDLDWTYAAFDVPSGSGSAALDAMRVLGLAGMSVTMPLKEEVAAAVDERSDDAAALGAVNCVVPVERPAGSGARAPTARASCGRCWPRVSTRPAPAASSSGPAVRPGRWWWPWPATARPGSWWPTGPRRRRSGRPPWPARWARCWPSTPSPASWAQPTWSSTPRPSAWRAPGSRCRWSRLRSGQVVADLVYQPVRTELLEAAAAGGCRTVDGVGMLVHQAALAFELWTGIDAPVGAMLEAAAGPPGGRGGRETARGEDRPDILSPVRFVPILPQSRLVDRLWRPGTMALQGTLDTFELQDVLRLLASTAKSGRLRLDTDRGAGSVWMDGGSVVAVESPAGSGDTTDAIFDLLRARDGSFNFVPEEAPVEPGKPMDVEPLLAGAEERLVEWREIEKVVPSMFSWVRLADALPAPEVTIDAAAWHTVTAIGSGVTVADLGHSLDLSRGQRLPARARPGRDGARLGERRGAHRRLRVPASGARRRPTASSPSSSRSRRRPGRPSPTSTRPPSPSPSSTATRRLRPTGSSPRPSSRTASSRRASATTTPPRPSRSASPP